jgi:energy-converting hydrogenase Eha subunit A
MWFIRIIYWLHAFAAPVIFFGMLALWIDSIDFFIPLLIIGAVTGVIVAEYIRIKIGLEIFFARIYGPNEMDEKLKKKK